MPTVKKYQGRVEEKPLPSSDRSYRPPRLNLDAYGVPDAQAKRFLGQQINFLGRNIQQVGSDWDRYNQMENERYDKSVVRQYENEDRTWAREYLVDQFDKHKGEEAIRSKEDGLSVYERTKKQLTERRRKRLKELGSEQQRRYYSPVFDDIEQRMLTDTSRYMQGANSQLEKQSYLASVESKYEDILANRDNDERVAYDLGLAERDLKNYYQGAPKEYVDVQIQKYRDRVHVGIVGSYINEKDPTKAWDYFRANEDDISETTKTDLKTALENSSLETITRLKARKIQINQKLKTFSEKIEAVKKLTSPYIDDQDLQTRVKELLLADYKIDSYIEAENERKVFENDVERINNAKTYKEALEIARAAKGSNELRLRKIATDMFTGGKILTDWVEYTRLRLMPHDKFVKVDLYKHRHQLGDTEYKELVKLQTKEKNEGKQLRVRTNLSMANSALDTVGLYADKDNNRRSNQREEFIRDFEERVAEIHEKTGKEPTSSEVKEVIDDLLLDFYEKSWIPSFVPFFGKDEKFKYQVNTPEERRGNEYTPVARPPELPKDAEWSWKYDGWVLEIEGKRYVVKHNKKVFLIPDDQWKISSK